MEYLAILPLAHWYSSTRVHEMKRQEILQRDYEEAARMPREPRNVFSTDQERIQSINFVKTH